MATTEAYLTAAELAELLRVTTKTVRNMVADGRLPKPIHLGTTTRRWDAAEVREWIARGKSESAER